MDDENVDLDHVDQDIENDAVIGSALRASLLVFIILAFPVILILLWLVFQERRTGIYRDHGDPARGASEQ